MKPRRALVQGVVGRVIPFLASAFIRLTYRTTRWEWQGREHLQTVIDDQTPVIFAFWHSRILMMCPRMEESPLPIRVLVSNNRDGEIISRVVQRFGHDTIRGSARNPKKSKQKGGGAAALEMLRHLQSGGTVAITPDGPRGPRGIAQLGASQLSALSGVPIIPAANSTKWGKVFGSWDRFLLPMPFGRGAYVIGEPILSPETDDASLEAHRLLVEEALSAAMHRADAMVGREAVT